MASPEMYHGMEVIVALIFSVVRYFQRVMTYSSPSLSLSVISAHMLVTSAGSMSRESFER